MRPAPLVLAAVLAASATARAQAIPPHASWTKLSWANGYGAGWYDTTARRLTGFRDHVFAAADASTPALDLLYDAYFGLRVGGQDLWLTSRPVLSAGYDGDTGIAVVEQDFLGVHVTERYFAPFGVTAPVLVAVVDVDNQTGAALSDASLFSIENLHVGSGDGTIGEAITWDGAAGEYEERGARGVAVHRPLPAPTVHACSPQNPYAAVTAGGHMVSADSSGTMDDAVAGFEWDLSGLGAGQTRTFAVVLAFAGDGDRTTLDGRLDALGTDPAGLLTAAEADWATFQAGAAEPDGLTADEQAVYRRQLAVLRMGQALEPGAGRGQLVASAPPGMWNIAWVRDQAYGVTGLVHAHLYAQAKDALGFWLGAQAGGWVCCDSGGGDWVGTDYGISVVRYRGDGSEESDSNADGPNIEFDGFGLVLGALDDYVAATGDTQLVTANADRIFAKTADVLAGLVEPSGAAQGLIRADSSIWETHWYNGGRKHYAYTQAAAVRGLRAAADLATRVGRTADATRYQTAADGIAAAVAAKLVDGSGAVKGNLEETAWLDGAAVEVLNWDVVPADGAVAKATLAAFDAGLWNGLVGHGYHRNDDGGPYDQREWVVLDLRIATALRRAGRTADADQLIAWVTSQARLNFELLPENYDRTTGDYQGEVPMVGFGAGAYVTALWERGPGPGPGPDAGVGTPDAGPGGPDAGTTGGGGGGCCDAGGSSPPIALTLLVLGLALRRRAA